MSERSLEDLSGMHMAWKIVCVGISIEQVDWAGTLSAMLLTGPVEGGCNCYQGRKSVTQGDLDGVALRTRVVSL